MNIGQFVSANAGIIGLLAFLVSTAALFQLLFWLVENITEEKRRNQYRVITDFENPLRYRLQNRWKTLIGWSK